VALLIILGLAGLRGAVATPRWDGPLHRDGPAIGVGLEVVFAVLILATLGRNRSGSQQPVARKVRGMLLLALGAGMAVVSVVTTAGLHLHLFTGKNVLPPSLPRPRVTLRGRHPVPSSHGSAFHLPVAALLYTLLVLLLLAGVVLSVWWARRLQPALGPRAGAFIAEDSEGLREAVASGRSALRTVDDARAAITWSFTR
jgi:cytochrome bd-type quinol oxidase subunit 2